MAEPSCPSNDSAESQESIGFGTQQPSTLFAVNRGATEPIRDENEATAMDIDTENAARQQRQQRTPASARATSRRSSQSNDSSNDHSSGSGSDEEASSVDSSDDDIRTDTSKRHRIRSKEDTTVAARRAPAGQRPDTVESMLDAAGKAAATPPPKPAVATSRASLTPTPSKKAAMVNARGMWRHWTLLFKTPLMAVHDLLDNSVDATQLQRGSRIYVDADENSQLHGIKIINNSIKPIDDLSDILSPYTSKKDGDAEQIGQSGVGLKQSSATLSDLNFVLVRNKDAFSFGIIAYSLQPEVGDPSFPSFELQGKSRHDIRIELDSICREYPEIGDCLRHYGNDRLESGREQLLQLFIDMSSNTTGWGAYEHVFTLAIADLRHRHTAPGDETDGSFSDDASDGPVAKLLSDVSSDMPQRYLSIPVDVRVSGEPITFNYWQTRLVELTQFDLPIHKTKSIVNDTFFKTPPIDTPSAYKLRVYAGFDTIRVNDVSQSKFLSLYIYSRKSGRLIEKKEDARHAVGITAGGTEYSQGLTLIVDDYDGNLKLNSAKTEVTFSQEAHGQTHSKNLYAWLNVAIRFYYDYAKQNFSCGAEKGQLTEIVRSMEQEVWQLISSNERSLDKPMHKCVFSRFSEIATSVSAATGKIRKASRFSHIPGPDTKLVLKPVPEAERKQPPSRKKRKASEGTAVRYNPGMSDDFAGRGGGGVSYGGFDSLLTATARRASATEDSAPVVAAAAMSAASAFGGKRIESMQERRIKQLTEENENLQIEYEELKTKYEFNEREHAARIKELSGGNADKQKRLKKQVRQLKESQGVLWDANERLRQENEELKIKNDQQEKTIKRLEGVIHRRGVGGDYSNDSADDPSSDGEEDLKPAGRTDFI